MNWNKYTRPLDIKANCEIGGQMRTVICIAIIMMVQVGGCTEDSVVGVVDIATDSCVPNQTFSCPCLKDGIATFGVQTCQTDGVSFSPCECSLVPMAPSSPRENKREELEIHLRGAL